MASRPSHADRADSGVEALRVLLVSHYYPPHLGGIENVVQAQATRLAAAGVDVEVVTSACTGPAESSFRGEEAGRLVRLRRVAAWNGVEDRTGVPFPVFAPSLWSTMLHAVRRARVVHVHDVLYQPAWVAAICCLLLRRPLVLTQHVAMVDHPSALVRGVQRLIYASLGAFVMRRARRVYVLNDRVRRFVVRYGARRDRVVFLPNGVDIERFRPPGPDERAGARAALGLGEEPVALFVGRFVPKKGYRAVLDAACPGEPRDYLVALAGGSPDREAVRVPGVVWLGALDGEAVARAYRGADMFVLPSRGEGFPLTVQEAMASGLPVITSDDPAYVEYGLDRDLVRLVPPEAGAVRAAIAELAADPNLRSRMGQYSRRTATSDFSWNAHCARLLRDYRDVVAAPVRAPSEEKG